MPTYSYLCQSCGHHFDQFQGINEDPLKSCPECSGHVTRTITGGSGFIMKGGGTRNITGNQQKPSCGKETTCCGREYTCGKTEECR